MFTKTSIAFALVAAMTTAASAATVKQHSVNPGYDAYVNGRYVGSDPDALIRSQMQRDDAWRN